MTEPERLRGELVESETKYRNLIELAPDAILIHQDGKIVFVNPAAVALLGAAGESDLVGRPVLDIVHPDMREHVGWNVETDLRGEESPLTTVDLLRMDGLTVTIQGRGARIPHGGRHAVQVVLRDVTEAKRVEDALKDYAARLEISEEKAWNRLEEIEIIYDTAPIGLCVLDTELRFVRLSRRFAEIAGAPVEAHIGRTPAEIMPDLGRQIETTMRRVIETGEQLDLELCGTAPTTPDVLRHWNAHWAPLRGASGTIVAISATVEEITRRKRIEEALRERERTLQGIFRAVPIGIGIVSDRMITEVNAPLCRMTGYAQDELIGQDARLLYPSDETYAYVGQEKYAQIAESGRGAVETQWRTKDGTVLDILLSSSPVDLSLPNQNVVFSALDITKLRESERALESYMDDLQRSNEELQRFAYVASHDLQEPLRSIVSFSQLLVRKYRGRLDADADEYLGYITEGGQRMQALIQDLLQLSRVETQAKPLSPTDAAEVVADVLRLMEVAIREAGATVVADQLPTVLADAAQLAQVFTNLIGNALKYRHPGVAPAIRISAEPAGTSWRFTVKDNGIGIEAEYFDRIFVIFQRLHTRDAYPGTGIGLAVVKKIVERHGGRIRVESTPGEGSTFSFTLSAA